MISATARQPPVSVQTVSMVDTISAPRVKTVLIGALAPPVRTKVLIPCIMAAHHRAVHVPVARNTVRRAHRHAAPSAVVITPRVARVMTNVLVKPNVPVAHGAHRA